MDVIVYGAGDLGKKFLDMLHSRQEDVRVVGYADSNKTGEYMGLPIVDITDVSRYDGFRIVICIIHMEFVFEVFHMLKKLGYMDIYLYLGKDKCFFLFKPT